MYRRPWFERINTELLKLPKRTLLRCRRESGIEVAIHRLHGVEQPRVVIWVDNQSKGVKLEDVLSEAIAAGLGSSLLGKQPKLTQLLQVMAEYQRVLGPITIVVGWAERAVDLLGILADCVTSDSRLLVIADRDGGLSEVPGLSTVEGEFLDMRFEEAISETRGAISDDRAQELFNASLGRYSLFRAELLRELGAESASFLIADPWSVDDTVSIDGVLDVLIQRERWADAFELACARAAERLAEFIDEAGNYYFNTGSYSYFWSRLKSLPPDVRSNEKVAYWLVAVALATSRQRELGRHMDVVLRKSDAPEVRASTAVVAPTSEMLSETLRALQSRRSTATLRAHGFALAWEGKRDEPIALFREAMRLAEREGAEHLVVACGVDISEVEIRHGNYKSGAEWAEWALAEYHRRGLNETLRRKSAVATLAFALLLLGDEIRSRQLLEDLNVGDSYIDVPGYEGIISTLADLALINKEFDRAQALYASIHENAPLEVFCFTALNVLTVHIARGDWWAARRLSDRAHAVSRTSSIYERSLGDLIAGIAASEMEPVKAEHHLIAALEGLTAEFHVAQAAAWLALVRLKRGNRKSAVQALKIGSSGLRELRASGWRLILACHPETDTIRELWTASEFEYEFKFLGVRKVRTGTEDIELGLRSAEILTSLVVHSSGLSGEQLHSHVYGDAPFPRSTLKASISRLRDVIPIASSPYRIDATFRADFAQLLQLVTEGELQRALNLYSGPLLPGSESPLVEEWREHIDEVIRSAVIESGDPDHLIQLGTQLNDDLEVWEYAKASVPPNDYRRPVINARIRRIRASWSQEQVVN